MSGLFCAYWVYNYKEVGLQNTFFQYEKQYEILCKVCFTSKDVRFTS